MDNIRPANEYRIGNFVLDEDGDICRMEQISSDKFGVFQQVSPFENKSCISTKYPSNIYAIKITDFFLLRFSKKINNHFIFNKTNKCVSIKKTHKNTYSFFFSDYKIKTIKYIHEIQNLYFAFTGEELEVKL
jgi:hypothetical protein